VVQPGGADGLLTVRETAARLKVSTATVYALCERGELAHFRVLNSIRVRVADLDAFVASAPLRTSPRMKTRLAAADSAGDEER